MSEKKVKFSVKGMHCPSCEMLIINSLEEQEGVKKVKVSHTEGTAIIEYDEEKVDTSTIKNIIKNEGYEVE